MRVVLVIPTLTAGGAERVMSIIANNWALNKNLEVHLVLLADDEIFYPINDKVIIHKLDFPINPNFASRGFSLFKLILGFRKLIKKIEPEFVLSFMNKYNIFVLSSLLGIKVKIFVSERDSPTEKLSFLVSTLRDLTYKRANGIIAQTHFGAEYIRGKTKNKNVTVIANPIKKIFIDPNVIREKIIISTGRLVEKKGHKYLLEAFSRIRPDGWKIVILGEGPLRGSLENYAKDLGIRDNVFMPGTIKEIDIWLNRSLIFAFPSLMEGFPNALAEAMSAGLACVSFDCDTGPSELIENGKNGFLVEVGNVNEFSEKLKLLCDDPQLRSEFSDASKAVGDSLSEQLITDQFLSFCLNTIV